MDEEKIFWDAHDPLKPVEGESSAASTALHDYAHMGYSRSLRKLHKKYEGMENPPSGSYMTIAQWSKTLDWQDRIARWEELERMRSEKVWRERRDSLREKEWDSVDKLQDIIANILEEMPNFVKRKESIIQKGKCRVFDSSTGKITEEGQIEKRAIILRYDVNAAIKFIKTASDIGRRAAEMDKSSNNLLNEIDFSKLDPDQVSRIAEGEHILDVLGVRK
jgi:hypothetical protein